MPKSKTRAVRTKVRNPDGSGFLVFTIENTGNLDLERLGEKLVDTYKRALEENRMGASAIRAEILPATGVGGTNTEKTEA